MNIIITISKGLIARNLLQNGFFELIKKNYSKVIIVSTASEDERFVDEFKDENVEIIKATECPSSFFNNIFDKFYRFLIYNKRTEMMSKYEYTGTNSQDRFRGMKYFITKIIFYPLSKLRFFRKLIRFFDYLFLQKDLVSQYKKIILQYKPNVVFASNIVDNSEVALVKAAKKYGIRTVCMCKSWDNPSKMYFRVKSDVIAVWSEFMKSQMIKYQDYKADEIAIVGVPQFDYYTDKTRILSRIDFCDKNNLDPKKRIILFGSEGKLMPTDSNIVQVLKDLIVEKKLYSDWQIFVRPHFAYTKDRLKFKNFFNNKNIIVDNTHNFSKGFSDMWDYSKEQMDHFLNILYHSDIVVLTASTLALDAVALGKPIIFIKFNGYEKSPKRKSVSGWYTSDYYSEVIKYNPGIVANSPEELKRSINMFDQKGNIFKENQKDLCDYFCYKIDGKSGKRLFRIIFQS